MCRKSSKNHNMSSPNPRTSQNSNNTLNNHRHIDNNPIPNTNFEIVLQPTCKVLHSLMKLSIGNGRSLHKIFLTLPVMGLYTKYAT